MSYLHEIFRYSWECNLCYTDGPGIHNAVNFMWIQLITRRSPSANLLLVFHFSMFRNHLLNYISPFLLFLSDYLGIPRILLFLLHMILPLAPRCYIHSDTPYYTLRKFESRHFCMGPKATNASWKLSRVKVHNTQVTLHVCQFKISSNQITPLSLHHPALQVF